MFYIIGLIVFMLAIIFFVCALSAHNYIDGVDWRLAFIRFGIVLAIFAGIALFFWLVNGTCDYIIGSGK